MHTIPIDAIFVPESRQRKDMKPAAIAELKKTILAHGLLHPIILSTVSDENGDQILRLVAGGTRLKAITELAEEGHTIRCNAEDVPLGFIPFNYLDDLPEDELQEAELNENLIRTDLTWAERVQAQDAIHRLRQLKNPTQTATQTAREIADKTSVEPSAALSAKVARSLVIAKHLNDPSISSAKSMDEAYKRVLDKQSAQFKARLGAIAAPSSAHQLLNEDCLVALPKLEAGSIDTILCDPPYGIDADKMKKTEKHFYDDSPENALNVCKTIIREGFRLLRPKGVVLLFCDLEHFLTLREYGKQQGYTAWRTPIVWYKGSVGHAPWGRAGFLRTYETILFLTKGMKELLSPGPDVLTFSRQARGEKEHAAEKPVELLAHLLKISSLPGDVILDPCCGSGSIIPACDALKLKAICIELDPHYFAIAMGKLVKEVENEPV